MPLRIVRNDITKMDTQAVVNTANEMVAVAEGCDTAIYNAAGYDRLLDYRREHIGEVPEGEVFITPGFDLPAEYIIHAVSPLYIDGQSGEEEKLRSCYKKSLKLAAENGISSIAFPLISTGSFGYPNEEGMRIAVDEINAFLLAHEMLIYLVVFDDKATRLGGKIFPDLEEYIDENYVDVAREAEYGGYESRRLDKKMSKPVLGDSRPRPKGAKKSAVVEEYGANVLCASAANPFAPDIEEHESKIDERIRHLSDTFSQYLLYLIQEKGMENAEVYKRAIVDKKTFSKIKNNVDYHPTKLTALCLCVGAKLNMDETRDLLARAGYALSPCDKTDIIFSYFIENELYDMIELDIQLEEHGLPCIIS